MIAVKYPDGNTGIRLSSLLLSLGWVLLLFMSFTLLWLVIIGEILFMLFMRGFLKTIYTPLFYLTLAPVFSVYLWYNQVPLFTENVGTQVLGLLFIFMMLDLAHAHFVAPLHSRFVKESQKQPPAPQSIDIDDENAKPDVETLQPSANTGLAEIPEDMSSSETAQMIEPVVTPEPDEPARLSDAMIKIGNNTFVRKDIRWIKSDDHYLNVQVGSKSIMVRANLSDVTLHLHQADGAQLNRSLWVAHSEIEDLQDEVGGRLLVTLANGETYKIPKTRTLLVKQGHTLYLKNTEGLL